MFLSEQTHHAAVLLTPPGLTSLGGSIYNIYIVKCQRDVGSHFPCSHYTFDSLWSETHFLLK